ncbi:MAG: type II toxin-antitoxin system RelE/ParE family toxin [bacterium]
MKLKLFQSNKFKKHYPKRVNNQEDDVIFISVIENLLNQKPLEPKFKDHRLTGDFNHCRECHVKNDLLLIYQVLDDVLRLIDIGTHSQLFG